MVSDVLEGVEMPLMTIVIRSITEQLDAYLARYTCVKFGEGGEAEANGRRPVKCWDGVAFRDELETRYLTIKVMRIVQDIVAISLDSSMGTVSAEIEAQYMENVPSAGKSSVK